MEQGYTAAGRPDGTTTTSRQGQLCKMRGMMNTTGAEQVSLLFWGLPVADGGQQALR